MADPTGITDPKGVTGTQVEPGPGPGSGPGGGTSADILIDRPRRRVLTM